MNMLATIDLGGTHCRFARFAVTAHGLALEAVETCPTARLQDGSAVLAQWESCLHTPLSQVAALVMGVAGPVQDGLRARLSNAPLRIDLNAVMPQGTHDRGVHRHALFDGPRRGAEAHRGFGRHLPEQRYFQNDARRRG